MPRAHTKYDAHIIIVKTVHDGNRIFYSLVSVNDRQIASVHRVLSRGVLQFENMAADIFVNLNIFKR